jgi:hypothetical protein
MRALCGAIITAGALLGLGLTAIAFAGRYHVLQKTEFPRVGADKAVNERVTEVSFPKPEELHKVDMPLFYILAFLSTVAVIGLAIAFFGLAYHHHRRHLEHLREEQRLAAQQRTPV